MVPLQLGCRWQQKVFPMSAEAIVRGFFARVRSGVAPHEAALYLAPQVQAWQVCSAPQAECIVRTPDNYRAHIDDFRQMFGDFTLQLDEVLAQGNKVYVRWRQFGQHLAEIEGYAPTGLPLVCAGSAVYEVADGRIVAYWMQQEHHGLLQQLQANARHKEPA